MHLGLMIIVSILVMFMTKYFVYQVGGICLHKEQKVQWLFHIYL